MSPDKRVYDVAKELNITTKELIEKLDSINIKIKSHSSTLTSFQIAKVKELFNGDGKSDKKSSRPKAFVVKKVKKAVEEKPEEKKVEEPKVDDVKSKTQGEEKKVEEIKEKPDIRELILVREGIKKVTKTSSNKKTTIEKKEEKIKQQKKDISNVNVEKNNDILKPVIATSKQESDNRNEAFSKKEINTDFEQDNKNYIKPRDIKAEFNEKVKVKKLAIQDVSNEKKVQDDKKDSNVKKPIARHIISQDIYDSKGNYKKTSSKQNLKDKKKSKEEMQEMISLEKAMAQKHKKKVHEENEKEVEVKQVVIDSSISVGDLAKKIQKSPAEIVRYLMMNGVLATVNQIIDVKMAKKVVQSFGIEVLDEDLDAYIQEELKKEEKINKLKNVDEKLLKRRAPVVSIMGHVDHGKTTLLDSIRASKHKIVTDEVGGITQSIGAYTVFLDDKKIVFVDTPGHEAFTEMRARGAKATDIAILVVAADDGIMPQTIEAINHAKAAEVPIIVAINKMDKPDANPDKIMQQLTEYGLVPEAWGGDTICVKLSALTGMGLDELLEYILLTAEILDLKANPDDLATGVVIEANLDKGKGPLATLLIQYGTLKVGDSIVVGNVGGKVRALLLDSGEKVKKAGPSTPVEILGLNEVPQAGDTFEVVKSDKEMKNIIEQRKQNERNIRLESMTPSFVKNDIIGQDDQIQTLNLIIKANTHGSAEAVSQAISQVESKEIITKLIHVGVGDISEADVMLASASNAIILGFTVKEDPNVQAMAEKNGVQIKTYNIIYQVLEDVEKTMLELLKPEIKEVELGKAEIRQIFTIGKTNKIAGCYVLEGKIVRGCNASLIRNGQEIFNGQIDMLKRFKDDVKEVASGFECGVSFAKFNDIQEGDVIQVTKFEEIERKVLV